MLLSTAGFLFFGFIIASYVVGVWVGTKIAKPKVIIKKEREQVRGPRRRR